MFGRNRIPQKDEETTWTRITAMPEQALSGIFDDNKSKKVQQHSVPNLIVGGFQDNNLEPLKLVPRSLGGYG